MTTNDELDLQVLRVNVYLSRLIQHLEHKNNLDLLLFEKIQITDSTIKILQAFCPIKKDA